MTRLNGRGDLSGQRARRVHAGWFFFGRKAGRTVDFDGVIFVRKFFGTLDAAGGLKREAHLCSKRL
jgi:hypothetical protein